MSTELKNPNNLAKKIINNLNTQIKKVQKENEYFKLDKIFYSENNLITIKDFEEIINYYLEKIHDFTIKETDPFFLEIEKLASFFDYAYFAYDNKIKRNLYKIQECAEYLANDLIAKCCKSSDRILNTPINLNDLITYGLSYKVTTKEIEKAITWIILRLALAYFLLTNK